MAGTTKVQNRIQWPAKMQQMHGANRPGHAQVLAGCAGTPAETQVNSDAKLQRLGGEHVLIHLYSTQRASDRKHLAVRPCRSLWHRFAYFSDLGFALAAPAHLICRCSWSGRSGPGAGPQVTAPWAAAASQCFSSCCTPTKASLSSKVKVPQVFEVT